MESVGHMFKVPNVRERDDDRGVSPLVLPAAR